MIYNRILVFSTDDYFYPAGGAEQAFGNIAKRLPHITFDLICARLRPHAVVFETDKNICVHRIGLGIPVVDKILLALFGHVYAYRLMRKNSYDLIWSIMASYGAFSAVRIKRRVKIPFLLTLQEGDSFDHIYNRVRYVRSSFNTIFKVADGIQAISSYLLTWGKDMGYKGNEGVVIPNGVDIPEFTQKFSEDEIAQKRFSFGFPDDSFIFITSSRLEKKNGIKDVINALPLLPKKMCFVICGSGSLDNEIRAQVECLGLQNRVSFRGFIQPADLPIHLRAADAFIRPSLSEGLGNAFLEAMVARIPIVGTNVGGISDFLTDGVTGFFVSKENPESIASGMREVMMLTNTRREILLNNAESLVREQYDWKFVAKKMESLFNVLTKP